MNPCDLQAVLVSSDPVVVDSVSTSLDKLGIAAAVYQEASEAMRTLSRQKTDAFLVDRELDPELSVLKAMRHSTSSRSAVAFAICSQRSSAKGAFSVADFVIDKPVISHRVNRTMKAAYGIMLKERMRYFRHSFRTDATVIDIDQRTFTAQTSNISQTGIALECVAPLIARQVVQVEFALPGDHQKLNCKAQVIWVADGGKTGLTFTDMSGAHRERLNEWIQSQFLRRLHPVMHVTASGRSIHATV
jgi:DNA-binding response OmpR family regulator